MNEEERELLNQALVKRRESLKARRTKKMKVVVMGHHIYPYKDDDPSLAWFQNRADKVYDAKSVSESEIADYPNSRIIGRLGNVWLVKTSS